MAFDAIIVGGGIVGCTSAFNMARKGLKFDAYGADLVVVCSHGRRGVEGLLLGRQVTKLLTHTKVPALVVR